MLGICLTPGHVTALTHHLVEWVLQAFKIEGHALYRTQFAETHQQTAAALGNPAGWAITANDMDIAAKTKARHMYDVMCGDDRPTKKVKDTNAASASHDISNSFDSD